MDVTLRINGMDLSNRLATYKVTQEATFQKTVTTLDHAERVFGGFFRPVITFSLYPLTDEESTQLYNALLPMVFQATFTQPYEGRDLDRQVRIATDMEASFALLSVDGKRRYTGGEMQLRVI